MTFLEENPHIRSIRPVVADLNGQARGKRMPARFADKALGGSLRMPLSALNVDIWGYDIEESPLVFETGDQDGCLRATDRGFVPMPWLATPSALLPMWMYDEDGTPFYGDPRHALDAVLKRFADRGLFPVVATELEFFLVDDSGETLQPPHSPRSGKRRLGGEVLSIRALDAFDQFFNELYDGCDAMGIPAESAISESGMGQYEINLSHGPALRAADDTWLFKLLVRGLARQHGFAASFMAKPYPDHPGNGLHMHFSVLDESGQNVFDDGTARGTDRLMHAVAGCLEGLSDSALVLAPHGNSYDRLVPLSHAPTGISWGYDNRTVAIRIPGGPPAARRIEHRVAGGDINPYLFMATVLGAALDGIEREATPPPPVTGNAYEQTMEQLPGTWEEAIGLFEASGMMRRILPKGLVRNYALTKRQELAAFAELNGKERLDLYLDTV